MSLLLNRLHPAVLLLSWVCLVVIGQTLEGRVLLLALLPSLLISRLYSSGHLARLLRRARYLLLTIALLFICGTPGEALWPWAGAFSPTTEGIALALLHGGRLLLVLALLALLLEFTPPEVLVAGVYGLLAPFAWLPRERVALRLMLVLQYAEEQKGEGRRRSWREWLDWLECQEKAEAPEQAVRLRSASLGGIDLLLLIALSLLVAAVALS